jgi:TolA-binding protein
MKNKYIKKSLPLVASIFTFAAIASVVGSVIVSKSGSTSLSSEAPTHINTPYAELITYEEQLNALQEEMNGLKAGISLLEKLDSLQTTMKVATTAMQDADSERTFAASAKSAASVAITTATTAKSSADADVTKAAKAVKDKEDIVNAANNVLKGVSTTDINKSSE